MDDLYDLIYEQMCRNCPSAHRCHNRCEECEEFQEELERQEDRKMDYKDVEGIDENGNPCTFKLEIPSKIHERFKTIHKLFSDLELTSSRNDKIYMVEQFKREHPDMINDLTYCLEVLAGHHKINFTLFISDKCPKCKASLDRDGHCYNDGCPGYDPVGHNYAPNLSIEDYCKPLFNMMDHSEASIRDVQGLFRGFGWFLNPLFNRVWRLGIGPSLLEKSDIAPMLAKKYDPEKIPSDDEYYLTEKLDGNRCIASYNFELDRWEFFSRSGRPLKVDFNMADLPEDITFDGEILSIEQIESPSQENFNKLSGLVNSKELNKTRLIYMIFDIMANISYKERRAFIKGICADKIDNIISSNVRILPVLAICTKAHLNATVQHYLDKITSRGGEGVMINLGSWSYQHKRTDKLLKVKNVYTMDMKVIDVLPGTGKNEGLVGSLECWACDAGHHNQYSCNVGSGLNDYQRNEWAVHPEKIIGKIVEVAYFSVSQNKETRNGTCYALRFPRFKRVREDKTTVSVD